MKIKEVCEKTGLTARTIRLYIEERLVFPEYIENYLGRKSYSFSDEDVKAFLNIATLRKYGFSIAEARSIIENKDNSASIIKDVCNRKTDIIKNEKETLSALLQLNDGKIYSVEEIAAALNSCQEQRDLPKDDTISKFSLLLKNPEQLFLKFINLVNELLFLIACGISVFFIVYYFLEWKYPHMYDVPVGLVCLFLTSIPALIIGGIGLLKKKLKKKGIKKTFRSITGLLAFPIVIISILPICFILIFRPVESLTTNIKNYRVIDENAPVYRDSFYNELFPDIPGGGVLEKNKWIYPDTEYYYRCRASFDFTTDILAEWSLEENKFYREIDRVKKLYQAYEIMEGEDSSYTYAEIKKGNYICLIRYDGGTPFVKEQNNYDYFIFAYDEENLRVRYILCYSYENGVDQPYYLELDW